MSITITPTIDRQGYEALGDDLRPFYRHDVEKDCYVFSVEIEGAQSMTPGESKIIYND